MSDHDAFSKANSEKDTPSDQGGEPSAAPNSAEPNLQIGSEFIGEGKKYATVDDAINSIAPAQEHISNLEKEMGELREELTKRESAQEILNRIDASNSGKDTPSAGLDKEAVAQLVNETVSQRDTQRVLDANKSEVNDKLTTIFKDKAGEVVSNKARELGVSVEYLQSTAEQSPKAFYQIMGLTDKSYSKKQESINLKSDVDTSNLKDNLSGSIQYGTYKYYQALRKENPGNYYTVEVQRNLHKHAKELGDNFYK